MILFRWLLGILLMGCLTKGAVAQHLREILFQKNTILFSALVDSMPIRSAVIQDRPGSDTLLFNIADSLSCLVTVDQEFSPGIKLNLRFTNLGKGNHRIENLVPFGEDPERVFITAGGSKEWPGYLCRSRLYRPGFGPVGVVLPDNAWHLGFTTVGINDSMSVSALARRGERDKTLSTIDRWKITLKPGGWAEYAMYVDLHQGDWHDGLRIFFRERFLYDLKSFDNSLFQRTDLSWMKHRYLMLLQFAWDKDYYDALTGNHTFERAFFQFDSLTGGFDIFTLWPTWPRLGLDQRNQWDMYRDLPGGIEHIRIQADLLHQRGRKYFISYNPWDEGTRREDHLKGMEELLRMIDADGVVLDTRGESSKELQAAADRVKPGIIMYSEGMAVPKDMPGIVSGRVHDALVLPPPLNLNKLIKPDFAIFRVLQLADDRLHREIAIAFFNGYGVEINTMRPGRPAWMQEEFAFLGRAVKILRENTSVFHNENFYPLVPVSADSIYVNRWHAADKTVYSIYSAHPRGFRGPLIEWTGDLQENKPCIPDKYHLVDLWNHQEINFVKKDGKCWIPVTIEPFDPSWLNTRREGNIGCIAVFPRLLDVRPEGLSLRVKKATAGDTIVISHGNPGYGCPKINLVNRDTTLDIQSFSGKIPEKIVVQLFSGSELMDEQVLDFRFPSPLLISKKEQSRVDCSNRKEMVEIPSGNFNFRTKRDPSSLEPFIPLPAKGDTNVIFMTKFYIDRYPVTNGQYMEFITQTGYRPADTINFLRHLRGKSMNERLEKEPVVWVSAADARAYAAWAGKRLPTESEWQYAAQGSDMRKYPWGMTMDSTRCNYNSGEIMPVGKFPKGKSPFGVEDLVGNVWQLTGDEYFNGSYYFSVIRGGSYYHPTESMWYVSGGALPVDHPEMLLMISPGLDRNATVGFRCAGD